MLFKAVFAFLSIGGATYALLQMEKAPAWLKFATVLMAIAAFIIALPDLPKGIDAAAESYKKIVAMFPPVPASAARPPLSVTAEPASPKPPDPAPLDPTPSPPTASGPVRSPVTAVAPIATPSTAPGPLHSDSKSPEPSASSLPSEAPETGRSTANSRLAVFEGATHKLEFGKTYFLEAPLGYTVGYSIEDGALNVYRDGEPRLSYCTENPFWTFARISKYSVIPCTSTVTLRVRYINAGDEIGSRRRRQSKDFRAKGISRVTEFDRLSLP